MIEQNSRKWFYVRCKSFAHCYQLWQQSVGPATGTDRAVGVFHAASMSGRSQVAEAVAVAENFCLASKLVGSWPCGVYVMHAQLMSHAS